MSKIELIHYERNALIKALRRPDSCVIGKKVDDIIASIYKEKNLSEIAILIGIWSYVNLILRTTNKDSNNSDLEEFMNEINTHQSKFLDDPGSLKDD